MPARTRPWPAGAVVLLVGSVALAARVAYFTDHRPALFSDVDQRWYSTVGHSFATGHFGGIPALEGGRVLSFRFPPAFPAVLGLGERVLFWMGTEQAQLWTCAILGAVAAAVTAVFALRVTSRAAPAVRLTVATVAGLLVALNPIVIGSTATLMSESLYMAVVAGALLAADHLVTRWSLRSGIVLGLLVALGALTRGEGTVVLGAIAVTALLVARGRGHSRALVPGVVALAIGAAGVVGWSAFASAQAGRPVVVSTNGAVVLGANCPLAWKGTNAGFWDGRCAALAAHRVSRSTREQTSAAVGYTTAHPFTLGLELSPSRQAEVEHAQIIEAYAQLRTHPLTALGSVPHRLTRGLGLSTSPGERRMDRFEGRIGRWDEPGRRFFAIVMLPLSLVGAWSVLARRSRAAAIVRDATDPVRLAPALVVVGVWLALTAVTYGSTRFRAAAEPSFALLTTFGALVLAVGAVRALSRRGREARVAG